MAELRRVQAIGGPLQAAGDGGRVRQLIEQPRGDVVEQRVENVDAQLPDTPWLITYARAST